ncbi:MAG: hypothetical protein RQ722_12920, partial [Desulfuromonadales bacterium]|nr:hypothetical protein [Desulfuromonadales bacterium]
RFSDVGSVPKSNRFQPQTHAYLMCPLQQPSGQFSFDVPRSRDNHKEKPEVVVNQREISFFEIARQSMQTEGATGDKRGGEDMKRVGGRPSLHPRSYTGVSCWRAENFQRHPLHYESVPVVGTKININIAGRPGHGPKSSIYQSG